MVRREAHAGGTACSATSHTATLRSGTAALTASAHARHVSKSQRRRSVIGSFMSSTANAEGCLPGACVCVVVAVLQVCVVMRVMVDVMGVAVEV